MNPPNDLLVLNVGFVAQQAIGYSRDFTFELLNISLPPDLVLRQFEGKVVVSRNSEGLLFLGEFQAYTPATCGRCLSDFEQFLKIDFTELYTFESHVQEDTELVYPEDGQVDLGPIVRDYFLLEMPINPLCKSGCKGLCPVCGNDLNLETCDHGEVSVDSRLAVLRTLLDQEDN
jgi:uncharacterized protein